MSTPVIFNITESISDIKKMLKESSEYLAPRLRMLLECKKHETSGVSKRMVAEAIGVNHNSVQTWRTTYIQGGIKALLTHKRTGYKPSVFSKQDNEAIKNKLCDAKNPIKGYVELQRWIREELDKDVLYTTVVNYSKRHFKSKVKVARKSHINKNEESVEALKKPSVKSASKLLKTKKRIIKK